MMAILFGEMLQFGLVLGTIMMGFTVSFFALFSTEQSYGEVGCKCFSGGAGHYYLDTWYLVESLGVT